MIGSQVQQMKIMKNLKDCDNISRKKFIFRMFSSKQTDD